MTYQQKRAESAYREMLAIDAELRWRRAAGSCSNRLLTTLAMGAGIVSVALVLRALSAWLSAA